MSGQPCIKRLTDSRYILKPGSIWFILGAPAAGLFAVHGTLLRSLARHLVSSCIVSDFWLMPFGVSLKKILHLLPMKPTDRKSDIINISASLFKEKGYSAVTMRDIAQALDIKAASLYNHIKSKQEILSLIIIAIAEEYTDTIRTIAASEEIAIQKLEKVIQLHIDITVRNPDALASLNNDWMHLPSEELKYFLHMREEYEEIFSSIVKKGIADGEIKNHNAEVIIFTILSTIRTLYLWYGKKKDFNSRILTSDLKKVLLHGIV